MGKNQDVVVVPASPRKSKLFPSKALPGNSSRPVTTGLKLKIRGLHATGVSVRAIAESHCLHPQQVNDIIHDGTLNLLEASVVDGTRKVISSTFLNLADLAAQHAARPDKLERLNAFQAAAVMGIAYDKFRLAENLSTQNITIQGIVQHLDNEREQLIKAREALLSDLSTENAPSDAQK